MSSSRPTTYNLPSEMGMFFVAPATSFHEPLIPNSHPSPAGVIPLFNVAGEIDGPDLSTTPRSRTAGFHPRQNHPQQPQPQLQQQQQQQQHVGPTNYQKKGISFEAGGSDAATCQDCGNQAKKECTHRRCRTCCRSRGFDCATHVRSTWVPASRRRERQMVAATAGGGGGGGASSGSTSGAKKPRVISSGATTSNSNTVDTGSSRRNAGAMPGEMKAPAVFRCVKVTALEGGEDQFAYKAAVRIGGHVFKGFLYDQGVDNLREGFPNFSELHSGGGGNGRSGFPAEVYGGGGALLGGSPFGNTNRN